MEIEQLKKIVDSSGFFRKHWYLRRYPDIRLAHLDPLEHFCKHGDREFRIPSPLFNSPAYVDAWGDVVLSGMGALEHFLTIGLKAGRKAPRMPLLIQRIISDLLIRQARARRSKGNITSALRFASIADKCLKSVEISILRSELLSEKGERRAAFKVIEQASKLPEARYHTGRTLHYAMCAAQLGCPGLAIEKLEILAHSLPNDFRIKYALASLYASNGRLADADTLFAENIAVICDDGLQTAWTGALVACGRNVEKGERKPRTFAERIEPPVGEWKAIYFSAADSVYFCRYALSVYNSLKINAGPYILVYFHVINPDSDAQQVINLLQSLGGNLAISTERLELDHLSIQTQRTLYSCARYLLAPEIITKYQVPLIIADIDQLVMSDLDPFFTANAGVDVGLLRFDHQFLNIFSFFSATLLIAFPTDGGIKFLVSLAKNLESVIDSREDLTWHLDQGMLAITQITNPDVSFSFFSPSFINLGDAYINFRDPTGQKGIFWSITNSLDTHKSKLTSRAFTQFQKIEQV